MKTEELKQLPIIAIEQLNNFKKSFEDILRGLKGKYQNFPSSNLLFQVKFLADDQYHFIVYKPRYDGSQMKNKYLVNYRPSGIHTMNGAEGEVEEEGVYNIFNAWQSWLNRLQDAMDFWTQFDFAVSTATPLAEAFAGDDEGDFSEEEKADIKIRLLKVKEDIKYISDLSEAQHAVMDAKLDYIIAKVDSLNKFDLKIFTLGILTSIIITLTFSQEQGKQLVNYFRSAFSNWFIGF